MTLVLICGVDEVGRGPLIGPVVAAAVILDPARPIVGLRDSKKLSPKQREVLALRIREQALAYVVAEASAQEIDAINILQATLLAMKRAVLGLSIQPHRVLIDGNRCPDLDLPMEAIVGGDAIEPSISAASILAKVERDAWCERMSLVYPGYGLERHKGYPTAAHVAALSVLGVTPEHRRSFAPVRKLLLV